MNICGSIFRRFAAGRRAYRQRCTAQTVGFISGVRRTGKLAGTVPLMRIFVHALDEEGSVFETFLEHPVTWQQLSLLTPGAAIPLRYKPKDKGQAILDSYPDEAHIQELLDRHECSKHPGGTPLEERREINRRGVEKKALLENLRLTGKAECGEREAEVTIRFFSGDKETSTARRRMYLNDRILESLKIGRYVDIRMVPGKKELFAFVISANHICPM